MGGGGDVFLRFQHVFGAGSYAFPVSKDVFPGSNSFIPRFKRVFGPRKYVAGPQKSTFAGRHSWFKSPDSATFFKKNPLATLKILRNLADQRNKPEAGVAR